ncbi:toll/interleukin-1 receptor domain-containing protein [Kitasatospora cineracea]|uniref:Tfp pilus assembly protein PilF n=1 Tax=Kitasatospora cineracea TaxID=88074 RepID=A0A8G1UG97_9ACTN|nr:toll/interleukin-1 receptor domain-containing protein [Kitasatospora cineracea]ROR43393.1 Tfp pilus assembly protein PilF [Kitasatospora cineracea]
MIKAFFSYSTKDADFVSEVASKVGRPFVHIDRMSFASGEDILASIDAAIRESGLFVLFLTRSSLESEWVNHEVNEARFNAAVGRIKKTLVVLMDQSITIDQVPEWLRRAKSITSRASMPVARKISSLVDDLVRESQHSFFVGRAREIAELQRAFVPFDSMTLPQAVCITGLLGIGRKTVLANIARSSLNFERIVPIAVEPGDSIQTIAAKVATQVDSPSTPSASMASTLRIEEYDNSQALGEVLSGLAKLAGDYREMPVLYDEGGILESDGRISEAVLSILGALKDYPTVTISIMTNRRPAREFLLAHDLTLPIVDVRQLLDVDVNQLIAIIARSWNLKIATETARSIASAVRGYPPSVMYALELVRSYGADVAVSQTPLLVEFGARPFVRYLRASAISDLERKILRIICANSPLPLPLLQSVTETSDEEIGQALMHLIDVSLIVPTDAGWYEISGPVATAVQREYQACSATEYAAVASYLDDFLDSSVDNSDYLALQRVLFRALRLAGREKSSRAYSFTADYVHLAKRFYHQNRDYESARSAAQTVVDAYPNLHEARFLLTQAMVKLGDYDSADFQIGYLMREGQLKDAFYLNGFLERHRGNHRRAVEQYEKAIGHGRGGVSVHRDMADCYVQLGDLERAERHIAVAQQRQPDNKFIIDLRIRIACMRRDEEQARELLGLLREIEDPVFWNHRASRVEYAFGDVEQAYQMAKTARDASDHPSFEILANFTRCAIKTHRSGEAAEVLDRLEKGYKLQKPDVRNGLRARLAITEGRFEDAQAYIARIINRELPVHLTLERDSIRGIIDNRAVTDTVRDELLGRLRIIDESILAKPSKRFNQYDDIEY